MAQRKGQSKQRRRRRRARQSGTPAVLILLCLLVGAVAIITAMTIFFKVQRITLTGETRYSESYVAQASGLEIGDNLVLIEKFTVIDRIFDACPYLDTVQMRRRYPDGVEIIVTECVPVAVIEDEPATIPDPEDKSEPTYYESRCVIRAVVEVDGADVCWLVCHMGLAHLERVNAVEVICKLIDETDMPVILMGDFNIEPDGEVLVPIRQRLLDTADIYEGARELTFPSDKPRKKIDYIFYRGLNCNGAETLHDVIADHLPVVADFTAEK